MAYSWQKILLKHKISLVQRTQKSSGRSVWYLRIYNEKTAEMILAKDIEKMFNLEIEINHT
tara:strand:- start:2523 stop:2705 length:183 start_codon:yes stop_codon:yes gene_type:complete